MIVDLPSTTTAQISKRLVTLRQDTGAMSLSRVLTLIVVVDEEDAEEAIVVANAASHQHPCRIITVVLGNARGTARLDGQIRVGGDAGASEVVVLRLYGPLTRHARSVVTPLLLPDSPLVVWWPTNPPKDPAGDPIGEIAQRRITDAATTDRPTSTLGQLAKSYSDGDSDLAWSRITRWRGVLAATLDRQPYEAVTSAVVAGAEDSPSTDLLAGWLQYRLKCPVDVVRSAPGSGLVSVRLNRASGPIDLVRPHEGDTATLGQPGQPERSVALAHRSDAECVSDELSRLDPDEVYGDALTKGLPKVTRRRVSMTSASRSGDVPSVPEARKVAARLSEEAAASSSNAMVEAEPEAATSDPEVVHEVAKERLKVKKKATAKGTKKTPNGSAKSGTRKSGSRNSGSGS